MESKTFSAPSYPGRWLALSGAVYAATIGLAVLNWLEWSAEGALSAVMLAQLALTAVVSAGLIWESIRSRGSSLSLTDAGLRDVDRRRGERVFPWEQIRGVDVERGQWGGRRGQISLVIQDGSGVPRSERLWFRDPLMAVQGEVAQEIQTELTRRGSAQLPGTDQEADA